MKKILVALAAGLLAFGAGSLRSALAQNDPAYPQQYPYGQPQQDRNLQGQQEPNTPPPPQGQYPPYPQDQSAPPPPPGPQGQAPPPPASQQSSQIQPGVARLSFIHGDVSQQRGDNAQWVAATLNTPVEPGDRVTTGEGARAELQLDYANVLRMSNNVTANVVALTRNNIQIQVGQGLTTYSVLKGSEVQSEIDTPNAAVHPLGEGDFRILVNSNAETQVIIRNGSAEISTPQGTTRVDKGQMITIAGTDNPQYKTDPAPGKDEWDSWNNDRDKRITSAGSWRNTNRYYTGSEDLDQNGTWSEIPDYGPVWTPSVDPGWAPYRAGRWVYEPYYGWTWVSYEPWGWAPYHYGRWMVYGGGWVWWPGPVRLYPAYYPIWAPAYVSFFGFGGGGWGLSFGIGFGGWGRVGWLPVGPGDWFHPWYGGWGGRYAAVGVGEFGRFHEGFSPLGHGFSNVNEAFRNGRVRDGFSSMAGNEFGRGAVSMRQERISADSFRQASVMTGRMPVNPSHESFSPSNRSVNPSTMRGGPAGSQRFFSGNRTGFAAGSEAVRGNSGFGANRNAGFTNGRGVENGPGSGSPANRGSVGGGTPGWRTFTPPPSGNRGSSTPERESPVRGFNNSSGPQRQFNSPNISPNTASRGGYGGSSNSYNRPPLNMRQPIVTPRGGYNESGRGGYGGVYNGSRGGSYGGYSAPRGNGGGGNSAPRGNYSAPAGGSSGGGSHGGGGGSHGGSSHGGHSR